MNITIKFFSSLMDYLPDNADGNSIDLSLQEAMSPHQILDRYSVPREEAQMIMLNGVFLPVEDREKSLQDGDTLSVWPAIQGG